MPRACFLDVRQRCVVGASAAGDQVVFRRVAAVVAPRNGYGDEVMTTFATRAESHVGIIKVEGSLNGASVLGLRGAFRRSAGECPEELPRRQPGLPADPDADLMIPDQALLERVLRGLLRP